MGLTREFLKGLDLDKDTIDAIMSEHGSSTTELKEKIQKLEKDVDEAKKNNEEVATLQSTIKDLEKKSKDYEKQVGELTSKNQELEDKNATGLKALKKEYAIKKAILKTGTIDETSYKAHLDVSKIEYDEEKDELTGFNEQDETIRKDYGFLFGAGATGDDHGGINGGKGGQDLSIADAVDEQYGN